MTEKHEVSKCVGKVSPTDLLNAGSPLTLSHKNLDVRSKEVRLYAASQTTGANLVLGRAPRAARQSLVCGDDVCSPPMMFGALAGCCVWTVNVDSCPVHHGPGGQRPTPAHGREAPTQGGGGRRHCAAPAAAEDADGKCTFL